MDTELEKLHRLDILLANELNKICEKHNIKYFMLAGTLLGAIRHKGFIPWDDDMDFGMRRADFERFIEVCSLELNKEKFHFQTMSTEKAYPFNFVKLTLKNTEIVEEFSKGKLKNNGIFIDIFPVDNISDNKLKAYFQLKLFWVFRNLLLIKLGYGDDSKKFYKFGRILSRLFPIDFLKYMKETVIKCANSEKSKKVIVSDGTYGLKKETIDSKWIDNLVSYQFEDSRFPGIEYYDEYLSYFYGDYMTPPKEDDRNHHNRTKIDFGPYL